MKRARWRILHPPGRDVVGCLPAHGSGDGPREDSPSGPYRPCVDQRNERRCDTCQRSSGALDDRDDAEPDHAEHDRRQHCRPQHRTVLGVDRPSAGGSETRVGEVAPLAVVRRGEGETEAVTGGGQHRRERRRAAGAARAPPTDSASTDASSSPRRRVGGAQSGDGGEHERRGRHEGDEEDDRRIAAPQPHDDRGEVRDPRRDEDQHQHRLRRLFGEP